MYLNCPSVFSLFNGLITHRPAIDGDVRKIGPPENPSFKDLWRMPCCGSNVRSGSDAIPQVQDLKKPVALTSTSAFIIKARANKFWQATEPTLAPHGHVFESRIPSIPLQKAANQKRPQQDIIHTPNLEPVSNFGPIPQPAAPQICTCLSSPKAGSEPLISEPSTPVDPRLASGPSVPSFSLQRAANEEQPGRGVHQLPKLVEPFCPTPPAAPLLTHIPLPQASQPEREPFIPGHPRHPSGSRFLSFSCQKAANLEEPDSEQQHIISLGSSPTEGRENALGLDLFADGYDSFFLPSVSSPYATQRLLSNSFPPAQSLLFLPAGPPPSIKINFNPFSPEEDTVPLPLVPESNQLGITYPVCGRDDHKLLVDTLPSLPLSPLQVPYLAMFPTQSPAAPSPLPIALLLSPWLPAPLPNELHIKIAGLEGYLNAENYRPHITYFLSSRTNEVTNSLVVVWRQLSHVDAGGARGMMSLKTLFAQLNEKMLDSDRTGLSSFNKLSITVPDLVKDVIPYNDLLQPVEEDDSIDLANASGLLELAWHGDFAIFASKFKNISFATLTVLNVKSSDISIEDAVTLLHSCLDLQTVSMGTIRSEEESEAVTLLKSSGVERKSLPKLTRLSLESDVALHPLIRRIRWTAQVSLTLTLRKQGNTNIHKLPLRGQIFSDIELNCHMTPQELISVQRAFPSINYNDIGI